MAREGETINWPKLRFEETQDMHAALEKLFYQFEWFAKKLKLHDEEKIFALVNNCLDDKGREIFFQIEKQLAGAGMPCSYGRVTLEMLNAVVQAPNTGIARKQREELYNLKQQQTESVDDFYQRIVNVVEKCQIPQVWRATTIVDKLIFGSKCYNMMDKEVWLKDDFLLSDALEVLEDYESKVQQPMDTTPSSALAQVTARSGVAVVAGEPARSGVAIVAGEPAQNGVAPMVQNSAGVGEPARSGVAVVAGVPGVATGSGEPAANGKRRKNKNKSKKPVKGQGNTYRIGGMKVITGESTSEDLVKQAAWAELDVKGAKRKLLVSASSATECNLISQDDFGALFPQRVDAAGMPKPGVLDADASVLGALFGGSLKHWGTCNLVVNGSIEDEFFVIPKHDHDYSMIGGPLMQRLASAGFGFRGPVSSPKW